MAGGVAAGDTFLFALSEAGGVGADQGYLLLDLAVLEQPAVEVDRPCVLVGCGRCGRCGRCGLGKGGWRGSEGGDEMMELRGEDSLEPQVTQAGSSFGLRYGLGGIQEYPGELEDDLELVS